MKCPFNVCVFSLHNLSKLQAAKLPAARTEWGDAEAYEGSPYPTRYRNPAGWGWGKGTQVAASMSFALNE